MFVVFATMRPSEVSIVSCFVYHTLGAIDGVEYLHYVHNTAWYILYF